MATVVLAHVGHWATDLAIYLGPLAVVAVMLWLNTRGEGEGPEDEHGPDPV
jgi:hypothetical protein